MAKSGSTKISWNQSFFDGLMKESGIVSLTEEKAEQVLARAKATAPVGKVKGGGYRDGLRIRKILTPYRPVFIVEGTVPYTLKVEARTGNLFRALKSVTG